MSARLSPAASLLRNSKLFSLPQAISLPPRPPASDGQQFSDTATSVYPQFASIEKPLAGGTDWGLKRPLPVKATRTTNNPVIRLVRGIDTPEHVADFENAAGHTLTLKKFNELNQAVVHQLDLNFRGSSLSMTIEDQNGRDSVFKATHDNTANLSSSAPGMRGASGVWPEISTAQVEAALPERLKVYAERAEQRRLEKLPSELREARTKIQDELTPLDAENSQRLNLKRWRYAGPSLSQMTGAEFEEYLHSLGDAQRARLRQVISESMRKERSRLATEKGQHGTLDPNAPIDEEAITQQLRVLRTRPEAFGPLIAETLDLPAGMTDSKANNTPWQYGKNTLATSAWRYTGPPKVHPSAGLSYLSDTKFATNNAFFGPQDSGKPVIARTVMRKSQPGGKTPVRRVGIAGFIGTDASGTHSTTGHRKGRDEHVAGQKILAEIVPSSVKPDGRFQLNYKLAAANTYSMTKQNKIIHEMELVMQQKALIAAKAKQNPRAPAFSAAGASNINQRTTTVTREPTEPFGQQEFQDMVRQNIRVREG